MNILHNVLVLHFICIHEDDAFLMLNFHLIDQDAQPRMIVQLWKANLEEPNFNQPDPAAIISDISKSKFSTSFYVTIACVYTRQVICFFP